MLYRFKTLCLRLFLPAALALAAAGVHAQQERLADLIQDSKRRAAVEMIRLGADVNERQVDGTTPLHWAVYNSDVELTNMLLSREADPNIINRFGSFPLAEAVKLGHVELVRALLEAGADPNLANPDGQTALMLSTTTGIFEIADLLVDHGADVNARERFREQSALMWAAAEGHADIVELLVDHGAEVSIQAKWNDWGSQITSEPRAQYRLTGGLTPLLYAARAGCTSCVEDILDAGADIDLTDPDGITPLMIAIDNEAYDTARYLLERGANPHPWDWWGRTALYIAVDMNSYSGGRFDAFGRFEGAEEGKNDTRLQATDIIRMLLEAGVNPDPQLNQHRPGRGGNSGRFVDDLLNSGATPLLRAANSQDVEAVKILLEYGAQVDLPNLVGITPFMAAAGFGNQRGLLGGRLPPEREPAALETVKVLLEHGADINAEVLDTRSHTARIARVSTLTNRDGQNALFAAAYLGWDDMAVFLIENGIDRHVVDDYGKSAWDAAMANAGGRNHDPDTELAEILKGYGIEPGPRTDEIYTEADRQ